MNVSMLRFRSAIIFLLAGLIIFSWSPCITADYSLDSDKSYDEFDAKIQSLLSADKTSDFEKIFEETLLNTQWLFKKYPLKPPDTSSPRATLNAFLSAMKGTHNVLMMANQKNLKEPGVFASESVLQLGKFADALFQRSVRCLNLSKIPDALKQIVGWEAAFKLKETLDRIDLPSFDQIPDDQKLSRWQLPNTDIVIDRVEEGPRKGEYIFASHTVVRIPDFYNAVKELAYRESKYVSPGFFDFYRSTPGRLLPPKWGRWLPSWSKDLYHGQTIWQWGVMVILLLVTIAANWLLSLWWRRRAAGISPMMRSWGWTIVCLVATAMIVILLYFIDEQINITGLVLRVLDITLQTITLFLLATASLIAATAVAETIIASPKIDPGGIHASLTRVLTGFIGFFAAAVIIFYGLSRLGISLIPLITGLGVGGLAVALAARPTLENIIGGFMILADRPYRVGQRVKVQGYDGNVEKIGLRSTRLRLRDGSQTIIPNETMARIDIENVDRRPYIRRTANITIAYDTPVEKVKKAIKIIEDILNDHEGMHPDYPPWVCFNEFNPDSLNIMMWYWYHPPEIFAAYAFHQKVNLAIMRAFEKEGIDFAFPTTTNYLTQEDKKPLQIKITGE